jgi:hypothetical protein
MAADFADGRPDYVAYRAGVFYCYRTAAGTEKREYM